MNQGSRTVTSLSDAGEVAAGPAETSKKPADFVNASPFPNRREKKDTVAIAVLAATAMAILAFIVSMLGLLQIHGPP